MATISFPGVSTHYHGGDGAPEASPYDDKDHSVVVLLTFAIFFSFVLLYLIVGVVWASALTAGAVALSLFYLGSRRRAALRRAAALNIGLRLARARTSGSGLEAEPVVVVSAIPAFAYKRESGGAGDGAGWAQCVICLGIVKVGEAVRRLPACKHLFHVRCIDMWLRSHSTCPICRAVVELTARAGARPDPPV